MSSLHVQSVGLTRRDRVTAFDPTTPPSWLAEHPMLCVLLSAWLRWRGDRPLPSRLDVDPLDIASVLPNVVYLDAAGDDFRFRLVGEAVNARFANRLKGQAISDLLSGQALTDTLCEHRKCIEENCAVLVRNTVDHAARGDSHTYVRLILPVGDEGGRATRIIGVVEFHF